MKDDLISEMQAAGLSTDDLDADLGLEAGDEDEEDDDDTDEDLDDLEALDED